MVADYLQATKTAAGNRGRESTPSEPAVPKGIGRYEITATLGQGNYGVVYEALDTQLQRKVALKVLPGRDAAAEGDLLREARAIAKLTHPNVVTVHEVGTTEDGRLFVTMELVEGETLKEWVARGGRTVKEVTNVYLQGARGLAAIHRAGLVHGDFKPANVLVGRDGRVRVADFGLARLHDPGAGVSNARMEGAAPRPEMGAGTPAYMAPEQHRGEPADARSDQFAFCVALFQGVYGWHPFPALNYADLVERVLNGRVRVPTRNAGVGSWRERRVPGWLGSALRRGLEVDPEQRWPTMDDLVAELARDRTRIWRRSAAAAGMGAFLVAGYLGGEQTRLAVPAFCESAHAGAPRVWPGETKEQVKGALLGTGVSYAPETWTRVDTQLTQYLEIWDQARTQTCDEPKEEGEARIVFDYRARCLDRRLSEAEAVVEVLTKADEAMVEHAVEAVSRLRQPGGCLKRGGADSEVPVPRPEIIEAVEEVRDGVSRAEALRTAGRFEAGLDEIRVLMEGVRTLEYPAVDAEVRLEYGKLLAAAGKYAEAARECRATTYLATGAQHYGVAADAAAAVVQMQVELGQYDAVKAWEPEAESAVARVGTESLANAHYRHNLATVRNRTGDFTAARSYYLEALAIKKRLLPPGDPDLGRTLNNLGIAYEEHGYLEGAEDFHRQTLDLFMKALGPGHPFTGNSHFNLSEVALRRGALKDAAFHVDQAHTVWKAAVGAEHPYIGHAVLVQADVRLEQKRFSEAITSSRRAIEILEKTYGAEHAVVARGLRIQGRALLDSGKTEEGIGLLERAVDAFKSGGGGQGARAHLDLARALRKDGRDPKRAIQLARGARDSLLKLGAGWRDHVHEADLLLQELGAKPEPAPTAG